MSKFNALFAYHRALLVLCLAAFIFIVSSAFFGALAVLPRWKLAFLAGAAFIVFVLVLAPNPPAGLLLCQRGSADGGAGSRCARGCPAQGNMKVG